mmetsp:Transcript_34964/g.78621  ORF Transcript_34964/g.78621 Transcript_34964/m.78621 type:complete len:289 (+) Transcript_34964:40-906(+)
MQLVIPHPQPFHDSPPPDHESDPMDHDLHCWPFMPLPNACGGPPNPLPPHMPPLPGPMSGPAPSELGTWLGMFPLWFIAPNGPLPIGVGIGLRFGIPPVPTMPPGCGLGPPIPPAMPICDALMGQGEPAPPGPAGIDAGGAPDDPMAPPAAMPAPIGETIGPPMEPPITPAHICPTGPGLRPGVASCCCPGPAVMGLTHPLPMTGIPLFVVGGGAFAWRCHIRAPSCCRLPPGTAPVAAGCAGTAPNVVIPGAGLGIFSSAVRSPFSNRSWRSRRSSSVNLRKSSFKS